MDSSQFIFNKRQRYRRYTISKTQAGEMSLQVPQQIFELYLVTLHSGVHPELVELSKDHSESDETSPHRGCSPSFSLESLTGVIGPGDQRLQAAASLNE